MNIEPEVHENLAKAKRSSRTGPGRIDISAGTACHACARTGRASPGGHYKEAEYLTCRTPSPRRTPPAARARTLLRPAARVLAPRPLASACLLVLGAFLQQLVLCFLRLCFHGRCREAAGLAWFLG
jgi:hypothetical protein